MGFGSSPLGATPAGVDVVVESTARDATTPLALVFDGPTLNFKLDSKGRYEAAHPIDTKVFHRLRIRGLSIRSAPATGNEVANRSYIDPLRIEAEVRDDVRLALEDMVDAGEIEDRGIELDTSVQSRISYIYRYVNLQTGKTESVPLQ